MWRFICWNLKTSNKNSFNYDDEAETIMTSGGSQFHTAPASAGNLFCHRSMNEVCHNVHHGKTFIKPELLKQNIMEWAFSSLISWTATNFLCGGCDERSLLTVILFSVLIFFHCIIKRHRARERERWRKSLLNRKILFHFLCFFYHANCRLRNLIWSLWGAPKRCFVMGDLMVLLIFDELIIVDYVGNGMEWMKSN